MTKQKPATTREEREGRLKEQICQAYMSCDWDKARRLEIRYFRQYHPNEAKRLGIPSVNNEYKYKRWLQSIPSVYPFGELDEPVQSLTSFAEGGIAE
jgi:hypothetical protein